MRVDQPLPQSFRGRKLRVNQHSTVPPPNRAGLPGVPAGRNLARATRSITYLGDELREIRRYHRHHYVYAGRSRSPPAGAINVGIEQRCMQNATRATGRRKKQSTHQVYEEIREDTCCSREGILCNTLWLSSRALYTARSVSRRYRPHPHVVARSSRCRSDQGMSVYLSVCLCVEGTALSVRCAPSRTGGT